MDLRLFYLDCSNDRIRFSTQREYMLAFKYSLDCEFLKVEWEKVKVIIPPEIIPVDTPFATPATPSIVADPVDLETETDLLIEGEPAPKTSQSTTLEVKQEKPPPKSPPSARKPKIQGKTEALWSPSPAVNF